ncbi:hypothetical protein Gotri_014050 [Gossypium trilobum]|uniref:Photosystem I reaction center subunit II, chloroplastic n=1 Tax=Gossypium trilobum TaxID=34281 RepID=A0A7J9DVN8_9ROSI|nr:hypothetical protein [Gossypium trilobum]
MAMATQASLFTPSTLRTPKSGDRTAAVLRKQPPFLTLPSFKSPKSIIAPRTIKAEATEEKAETTATKEAPVAQVEEFYVITWESPKEQIFEMPTGGAAIMRQGPNLLKLARKEQCLALGTRLRSKYKIKYQFYRVFPNGEVQYLHPKDGVYPEKVNPGRQGVGQNFRSIGKNVSPIEVKFTGKQVYDL